MTAPHLPEKPITRLGRAAFGIADDGETTQALTSRQETQGGRLNTIVKKVTAGAAALRLKAPTEPGGG